MMEKEIIILVNIVFIIIQLVLFIILMKRYMYELRKLKNEYNNKINNIDLKYKDSVDFLSKELKDSYNTINEYLQNTNELDSYANLIKKEINRCRNLIEDFSGKRILKRIIYEPIDLKKLINEVKMVLCKQNIKIDYEIEDNYYIVGDYDLLKEAFILIIKYYFQSNISITVKKYGKFYNIEFSSNYSTKEIQSDIVIDYISEIISKHKGLIKIKDKDFLRIIIVILPLEKKS